jgi:hypothetical protein
MKRTRLVLLACLAPALALGASGCGAYNYEARVWILPDGRRCVEVIDPHPPFLSRRGDWEVTHEWLDEATNTQHEETIRRRSDDDAASQVEAFRILSEGLVKLAEDKAKAAAGAAATP